MSQGSPLDKVFQLDIAWPNKVTSRLGRNRGKTSDELRVAPGRAAPCRRDLFRIRDSTGNSMQDHGLVSGIVGRETFNWVVC